DGHRTVRQVLLDSSLDEVTALEVTTQLYAKGIVVPVDEPGELSRSRPSPWLQPAAKQKEPQVSLAPTPTHRRLVEVESFVPRPEPQTRKLEGFERFTPEIV